MIGAFFRAVSAGSILAYRGLHTDSEPDRVVAAMPKCQELVEGGKIFDLAGSECQQGDSTAASATPSSYLIINSRLQLTVRTSNGSTYQIDVPITTDVHVGDTWPN